MLTAREVSKHNTASSCWVIIDGYVYDVTQFLPDHPGGQQSVLRWAGKDATAEYKLVHATGTVESTLSDDCNLGPVDLSDSKEVVVESASQTIISPLDTSDLLPLRCVQNVGEFEHEAKKVLSTRAFTYFHSASESLQTISINERDWRRLSFRPRVMRNVAQVDMQTRIMSQISQLPIFIAPTAMVRLASPDGELDLVKAAISKNIPFTVSTYASQAHADIADRVAQQRKTNMLFFQLYVPRRREDAVQLIRKARELGFSALIVTVDTPVVGKREEDDRYQALVNYEAGVANSPPLRDTLPDGEKPILRGVHSSTLAWEDLTWIREAWGKDRPIVLKGIQTAEDALLAYKAGANGIYLSNHGGRQLDFAPSAVQTLLEMRNHCPQLFGKIDIYVDGGVRRGTDVIKAIALGATAVAIGRPFLYALGAYGSNGVEFAIQLLSDEIETTMRLLGVTSLAQLHAGYLDTRAFIQRSHAATVELPSKL